MGMRARKTDRGLETFQTFRHFFSQSKNLKTNCPLFMIGFLHGAAIGRAAPSASAYLLGFGVERLSNLKISGWLEHLPEYSYTTLHCQLAGDGRPRRKNSSSARG